MASRPGGAADFPSLAELPLLTVGRSAGQRTWAALRWQVDSGRWQRLHPGVYVTHNGPIDWHTRAAGAILAVTRPSVTAIGKARASGASVATLGERTAGLAGWSAAYVQCLCPRPPALIDVVVPNHRVVTTPQGARVVRSRQQSIVTHSWPPRTSIESTIVALACSEPLDTVLALIGRGLQQRATSMPRLCAELAGWSRHPHRGVLRDIMLADADGCESTLELRWLRDVERAHGIPPAVRQLRRVIAGMPRRYDLDYEHARLRVELDGLAFHDQSTALVDRQKGNATIAAGLAQLRYGWAEVALRPCATAYELLRVANSRGAGWRAHPCRRPGCALGVGPPA
ncbi:hypothetical protein [Nostocoides sp.]|uniref:hypothetical protein n=1 Tax=Nostocoides sp. TaxID=1917966 RepID=UPI002C0F9E75|nr:hypothetical protein [Tetrasphaera sp.]